MVRITQCLCPQRHAIMAFAYQTDGGEHDIDAEAAKAALRYAVDEAVQAKVINPWCGLCGSRDWHYEDNPSKFGSMDEARPELERLERENATARAGFSYENSRN